MFTSKNLLRLAIALLLLGILAVGVAVLTTSRAKASAPFVCTMTGLTGPAQQENLLYCPSTTSFTQFTAGATPVTVTDTLAPSTYQAAISLAAQKHIIVGTPILVTETVDWAGCQITDVEFSRGFHAEHHNVNSACAPDLIVRYYSPEGVRVWP